MRYTIFKRGGYNQGVIGATGGEVAGKVILSRDPIGANEASTKNYVDVKFNTLPIGSFTSGVINAGRVPEFAGDIVKLEGNANTTVKTTTVSAGMYPKVTVNIKGQITGGATLVEGDIPVLPWSKIATGKPTTIGGYGISDCLSTSGGVITGSLKVSEVTSDAKCLVNKSYVDSYATGDVGVSVGGIIYRNSPTTPTGFLKCNGGEVSKTTYAALYSVIGYRYKPGFRDGFGSPWNQQYNINETSNLFLDEWKVTSSLPVAVREPGIAVTKNRVYSIGGWNASNNTINTIYTAPINADGTLGTWVSAGNFPSVIGGSSVVVTKGRIVVIGGFTTGVINTVRHAPINADGTIGGWSTATNLPVASYRQYSCVIKGWLYVFGGENASGTALTQCYRALINESTGIPGSWETVSNNFKAVKGGQLVVTDTRLYLIAGRGPEATSSIIRTANINPDGTLGNWVDSSSEAEASQDVTAEINGQTYSFLKAPGDAEFGKQYRITTPGNDDYQVKLTVPNKGMITLTHKKAILETKSFNATGTFKVPAGVKKISIRARGCSGTPYYPGSSATYGYRYVGGTLTSTYCARGPAGPRSLPAATASSPSSVTIHTTGGTACPLDSNNYSAGYGLVYGTETYTKETYLISSGSPAIAATTGPSVSVTINGNTVTFAGGYGGTANYRTVEYNNLVGNEDISFRIPNATGNVVISYYYEGEVITTTYTASVTLNMSYVIDEIDMFGLDTGWLKHFPIELTNHTAYVTKDHIYILGGTDNTKIYKGSLNKNDLISGWEVVDTDLPILLSSKAFTSAGCLFLIGGTDASNTASSSIHSTLLNGSTSDYSEFYSTVKFGTIDDALFALPNMVSDSSNNINYYIKY